MKIKVTYEKTFDTDEFFEQGCDMTKDEVEEKIASFLWDFPDEMVDNLKFEEVEE